MSADDKDYKIKLLRHAARKAQRAISQYQRGAPNSGCTCAFCEAKRAIKKAMEASK